MSTQAVITVPVKMLKAAQEYAADKDIRHYLNGVLIQATPHEVRAVATNGHILGVFRDTRLPQDVRELTEFIVPNDVIKGIKATATEMSRGASVEFRHIEKNTWTMRTKGITLEFQAIDGNFPDYTRVVPDYPVNQAQVPSLINADYLARIQKSVQTFYGLNRGMVDYTITYGKEPDMTALVRSRDDNFLAVAMPIRGDALPKATDASWARTPFTVPEVKQAA